MNNTFVYTNLSEIKIELKKRRKNKELEKKVLDFWGENPFPINLKEPRAILSRDITTPNMELLFFLDIIDELKLKPLFLELHEDKFVSKNKSKYHLGMLHFQQKKQRELKKKRIIDFNHNEGKLMTNIKTIFDNDLVSFHHAMLEKMCPNLTECTYDFSTWFLKTRHISDDYYLYFLSLFIYHGVLFDNYLLSNKDELEFYLNKIEPSFKKAEEIFGVRPLIFPLLPIEFEKDVYWYSYKEHLLDN